MSVILTPNMSLPVPVVGSEAGPEYATDINNCLSLLDSHNHAAGSGVQIDPTGLNINADLDMQSNNLVAIRSLRLNEQSAVLGDPSDLNCIYDVDGDLYFNDGLGNNVRLTQNGSVAGTSGSIANLVAPASASYVAANDTFVWESDTNTPANMDCGSVILRKVDANSPGITLQVPAAIASDYDVILPALPAALAAMLIDASGNITTTAWAAILAALVPAGVMLPYGGTSAPTGFLMCDGSAKNRTTYAALFAIIGETFGAGDGSTTFNLPDPRNVFIRGVNASTRSIGGVTYPAVTLGTFVTDQFQSHEHVTRADAGVLGSGNVATAAGAFSIVQGPPFSNTVGVEAGTRFGTETRPVNLGMNYIIKT